MRRWGSLVDVSLSLHTDHRHDILFGHWWSFLCSTTSLLPFPFKVLPHRKETKSRMSQKKTPKKKINIQIERKKEIDSEVVCISLFW